MEYLILIGSILAIFLYFRFKQTSLTSDESKLRQKDAEVSSRVSELHTQIDKLKEDINKPSETKTKEEILDFWNKGNK